MPTTTQEVRARLEGALAKPWDYPQPQRQADYIARRIGLYDLPAGLQRPIAEDIIAGLGAADAVEWADAWRYDNGQEYPNPDHGFCRISPPGAGRPLAYGAHQKKRAVFLDDERANWAAETYGRGKLSEGVRALIDQARASSIPPQ